MTSINRTWSIVVICERNNPTCQPWDRRLRRRKWKQCFRPGCSRPHRGNWHTNTPSRPKNAWMNNNNSRNGRMDDVCFTSSPIHVRPETIWTREALEMPSAVVLLVETTTLSAVVGGTVAAGCMAEIIICISEKQKEIGGEKTTQFFVRFPTSCRLERHCTTETQWPNRSSSGGDVKVGCFEAVASARGFRRDSIQLPPVNGAHHAPVIITTTTAEFVMMFTFRAIRCGMESVFPFQKGKKRFQLTCNRVFVQIKTLYTLL